MYRRFHRTEKAHHSTQGRNEARWCRQVPGAVQPGGYDGTHQPFALGTDDAGVWMRDHEETRKGPGGSRGFEEGPGGGRRSNRWITRTLVVNLTQPGFVEPDEMRERLERWKATISCIPTEVGEGRCWPVMRQSRQLWLRGC